MPMTFNQFQAELRKRDIEGPVAYMLTVMYEQMGEMSKQLDMCASVIEQLAGTLSNFVQLSEVMNGRLQELSKRHMADGIELHSVANEPEQ